MSRINDFSFSFKEPSKAHRVTVCVEEESERKGVCASMRRESATPWMLVPGLCSMRMHAKHRLLLWAADVFVTPDTITYYVFFWLLPLSFTTEWEK